jgi:adenosylmethionine-8-amino-7-oxononanoate aminotransferase
MGKMAFTHMFAGQPHQPGMDLADRLSTMSPVADARVFFGNSGSDANDTHLKMLRYYFNATTTTIEAAATTIMKRSLSPVSVPI